MTGNTDKVRGLLLAAIMVISVFGGTIAFAGTAAATDGSVTLNPAGGDDGVDSGEDLTINVTDSDGNTDDTAADSLWVAVDSSGGETHGDSAEKTIVNNSYAPSSGEVLFTGVIVDDASDGIDFTNEFDETSGSSLDSADFNVIYNDNGTVTIEAASGDIGETDVIKVLSSYTPVETVELTETGDDTDDFSGSITVEATTTRSADDGTLQATGP